ncbi:DUF2591 family protein [Pantoea agglomerans]|uniref:phage protein NinX family protein n=1 Tax=Enterobacter agglomerans TaxID=549 RepID=UPI00178067DB|nr:phage protein NinX family protein [Pantoea agglomerans]MBD8181659.1 DUF2591 family protein [Pantoea agglomerans]
MNYAEMSDFEVNKAVAVALGGVATTDYRGLAIYDMGESQSLVVYQCMHSKGDFLPCNSWADAGPIIAENQISLVFDADLMIEPPAHWVMCRHVNNNGDVAEHYAQPNKPLRAAMIVFLMMQEQPNA